MITAINKVAAKILHKDIDDAMEAVAAKHGLLYTSKSGRYNPSEGTFTTTVMLQTKGLNGEEREFAEFKLYGSLYQVPPEMYRATFTHHDGEKFEVFGFETSRPKFPIKARSLATGKVLFFTEMVIPRLVKREEVAP